MALMKYFFLIILIVLFAGSLYFAWDIQKTEPTINISPTSKEPSRDSTPEDSERGEFLFRYMVFGDNEGNGEKLKALVEAANSSDIAFVANTGDSTDLASVEEFEQYAEITKNLEVPIYSVAGDNDIGDDGTLNLYFKYVSPENYFSWNEGSRHFVAIYNVGESALSDEQLAWLEDDLKQNEDKKITLFMQIPMDIPFAEIVNYTDNTDPVQKEKFYGLISRYTIEKIFTGHAHTHFQYILRGIPVTITGGGGAVPNVSSFLQTEYQNHYIIVDVYEERIEETVIPF